MRGPSVTAVVALLAITVAGLHSARSAATNDPAAGARGEGGVIVWSPDGSYIAYTGGTEERDDVMLVDVASGKMPASAIRHGHRIGTSLRSSVGLRSGSWTAVERMPIG
jgi:Tol biopolymer transport system component